MGLVSYQLQLFLRKKRTSAPGSLIYIRFIVGMYQEIRLSTLVNYAQAAGKQLDLEVA